MLTFEEFMRQERCHKRGNYKTTKMKKTIPIILAYSKRFGDRSLNNKELQALCGVSNNTLYKYLNICKLMQEGETI